MSAFRGKSPLLMLELAAGVLVVLVVLIMTAHHADRLAIQSASQELTRQLEQQGSDGAEVPEALKRAYLASLNALRAVRVDNATLLKKIDRLDTTLAELRQKAHQAPSQTPDSNQPGTQTARVADPAGSDPKPGVTTDPGRKPGATIDPSVDPGQTILAHPDRVGPETLQLTQHNSALQAQLKEARDKLLDVSQRNDSLQEELALLKEELENPLTPDPDVAPADPQLPQRILDKIQKIETLKIEVAQLNELMQQKDQEITRLQAYEKSIDGLKGLRKKSETLLAQVETLERARDQANAENKRLQSAINERDSEMVQMRDRSAGVEEKLATARRDLIELKTQNAVLEARAGTLTADLKRAQSQGQDVALRMQSNDGEIKSLRQDVASLGKALQEKERQVARLQVFEKAAGELGTIQAKNHQLINRLEDLQTRLDGAEAREERLQVNLTRHASENNSLSGENRTLRSDLDEKRAELLRIQVKNETLQKRFINLESGEKQKVLAEIDFVQQIKERDLMVETLRAEIDRQSARIDTQSAEITRLEKFELAAAELTQLRSKSERLIQQVERLQNRSLTATDQQQAQQGTLLEKERFLNTLRDRNAMLYNALQAKGRDLKGLRDQVGVLETQLQSAQNRIEIARQQAQEARQPSDNAHAAVAPDPALKSSSGPEVSHPVAVEPDPNLIRKGLQQEAEIAALQEEIERLSGQLQQKETEIAGLREVESSIAGFKELKAQNKSLLIQVAELEDRLSQEAEEAELRQLLVEGGKAEQQQLKAANKKLRDQLAEQKRALRTVNSRYKVLEASFADLTATKPGAVAGGGQEGGSTLKSVADFTAKLLGKASEVAKLQSEVQGLTTTLMEKGLEIARLEREKGNMARRIAQGGGVEPTAGGGGIAQAAFQARVQLLTRLQDALKQRGIKAEVDPQNGILTAPRTLTFSHGSSVVGLSQRAGMERVADALLKTLPCFAQQAPAMARIVCPDGVSPVKLASVEVVGFSGSANPRQPRFRYNWLLATERGLRVFHALMTARPDLNRFQANDQQTIFQVNGATTRHRTGGLYRRAELRFTMASGISGPGLRSKQRPHAAPDKQRIDGNVAAYQQGMSKLITKLDQAQTDDAQAQQEAAKLDEELTEQADRLAQMRTGVTPPKARRHSTTPLPSPSPKAIPRALAPTPTMARKAPRPASRKAADEAWRKARAARLAKPAKVEEEPQALEPAEDEGWGVDPAWQPEDTATPAFVTPTAKPQPGIGLPRIGPNSTAARPVPERGAYSVSNESLQAQTAFMKRLAKRLEQGGFKVHFNTKLGQLYLPGVFDFPRGSSAIDTPRRRAGFRLLAEALRETVPCFHVNGRPGEGAEACPPDAKRAALDMIRIDGRVSSASIGTRHFRYNWRLANQRALTALKALVTAQPELMAFRNPMQRTLFKPGTFIPATEAGRSKDLTRVTLRLRWLAAPDAVVTPTLPPRATPFFLAAGGGWKGMLGVYRRMAHQADVRSQMVMGLAYLLGPSGVHNDGKARFWFRRSARQRDPEAQFHLGNMIHNALRYGENPKAALHWLHEVTKSADYRHPALAVWARLKLGVIHLEGQGKPVDLEQSWRWIRPVARAGHPMAQYLLGRILVRRGPHGDPVRAYAWLKLSSLHGYGDAVDPLRRVAGTLDAGQRVEAERMVKAWRPGLDLD
ncbi:MAG: SEL1-like repeat protein [Magnetococcales bacterium]|nr:SEL1-like repeat protein [Magnetococcales bacterium]